MRLYGRVPNCSQVSHHETEDWVLLADDFLRLSQSHNPAPAVTARAIHQKWWRKNAPNQWTNCGPNLMVRNDTARNRRQRPQKIASRKFPMGSSNAAGASSKSLKALRA